MGRQHRDGKLDRVYFDLERVGSYGGVDALHRATGEVPKRTAKRRFKRRRVVVGGQNQQWQDDLVDVANLKKYNDGTKFLLTVLDVFSIRA